MNFNKVYYALYYALILVLFVFIVDISFLVDQLSAFFLFLFFTSFTFQFLIFLFIEKFIKNQTNLLNSLSFIITGSIVGTINAFIFVELNSFFILFFTTILISVLPSSILLATLTLKRIKKLKKDSYFLKDSKVNDSPTIIAPKHFHIKTSTGNISLKINLDNLIYFESSDNYVDVFYLYENDVKKIMDRITLKKIERILSSLDSTHFFRVHKSYIVNAHFIESISGKAQAHKLKLTHIDKEIPISRSFKLNALEDYFIVD